MAAPSDDRAPRLDGHITLQKLQVFCMVVEAGTVTSAAERLFVAQPVVTAHLHSLEERLGVKLFERKGRKLELTAMGERVHRWAAEAINSGDEMLDEIYRLRAGELGLVRVGASMSMGSYRLPGILTGFRQTYPGATIELHVSNPERAIYGVEQETLDFCVVVHGEMPNGPVLWADKIGAEDFVLVAAPSGPVRQSEVTLSDLSRLALVGSPHGSVQRRLLDGVLAANGCAPSRSEIDFGHPEAIKAAVLDGAGAALLFRCSVEAELAEGALREVRVRGARLRVPVYFVRRRDRRLSPIQQRLRECIAANLLGSGPAHP